LPRRCARHKIDQRFDNAAINAKQPICQIVVDISLQVLVHYWHSKAFTDLSTHEQRHCELIIVYRLHSCGEKFFKAN